MTKIIVRGILITLLHASTVMPALAAFYWDTEAGLKGDGGSGDLLPASFGNRLVRVGVRAHGAPQPCQGEPIEATDSAASGGSYLELWQPAHGAPAPAGSWAEGIPGTRRNLVTRSHRHGRYAGRLAGCTTALSGNSLQWKIDPCSGPNNWACLTGTSVPAELNAYDQKRATATTPVAAWLFCSGIVGLIGIVRRDQKGCPAESQGRS
jgi:hypothetical protein